jgi:selenocysteine lyase/cysteine desulfurase
LRDLSLGRLHPLQPGSLSRTFWKANVVKMQKTFGAPIPDAAVDSIVDYLVKTYGAERPAASPPAAK